MAMQAIFTDHYGYVLTATTEAPPTSKFPPVENEDPTHTGCSICKITLGFDAQLRLIRFDLPATAAAPAQLEAMVVASSAAGTLRCAPDRDTLAAFVREGTAEWYLPAGSPQPTTLELHFGFKTSYGMRSHKRTVPVG